MNGHCFLIKVKSETFSGKKYVEGIQGRADRLSPVQQIISLVFVMIHRPTDIVTLLTSPFSKGALQTELNNVLQINI